MVTTAVAPAAAAGPAPAAAAPAPVAAAPAPAQSAGPRTRTRARDLELQAALFADAAATAARLRGDVPAPVPARGREPRIAGRRSGFMDRQNVHDSLVVQGHRAALERIRAPCGEREAREALDALAAGGDDEVRWVAEKLRGQLNSHVAGVDATVGQVLCSVWARARAPANAGAPIRERVADALRDMREDGRLVCLTGITGRLLGALAGADADPATWGAAPREEHRAAVNRLAQRALETAAARAAARGGPLADAAASWTDPDFAGDVPPDAAAEFLAAVRGELDRTAAQYGAEAEARLPGSLPKNELDRFVAEAFAAYEGAV